MSSKYQYIQLDSASNISLRFQWWFGYKTMSTTKYHWALHSMFGHLNRMISNDIHMFDGTNYKNGSFLNNWIEEKERYNQFWLFLLLITFSYSRLTLYNNVRTFYWTRLSNILHLKIRLIDGNVIDWLVTIFVNESIVCSFDWIYILNPFSIAMLTIRWSSIH
jgi:hypothetical protein